MPSAIERSSCHLLLAIVSILGPALARGIPAPVHHAFSRSGLLGLAGVILVSDLLNYLAHRLLHRVRWLWRLHAVHHSSERVDWLATSGATPSTRSST